MTRARRVQSRRMQPQRRGKPKQLQLHQQSSDSALHASLLRASGIHVGLLCMHALLDIEWQTRDPLQYCVKTCHDDRMYITGVCRAPGACLMCRVMTMQNTQAPAPSKQTEKQQIENIRKEIAAKTGKPLAGVRSYYFLRFLLAANRQIHDMQPEKSCCQGKPLLHG